MAETRNEKIIREFTKRFVRYSDSGVSVYFIDDDEDLDDWILKKLTAKDAEHKKEIADMLDTYTKGGKFRIGYQSGKEEANAEWKAHFDEMEVKYSKELKMQNKQWEKRIADMWLCKKCRKMNGELLEDLELS